MAIVNKEVLCFRCKRKISIDIPSWMNNTEEITCPHCDETIPIYPIHASKQKQYHS